MISKCRMPLISAILSLGFVLGSCADNKPVDESVQPAASQVPASPPETAGSQGEVTEAIYFAFDDYTLGSSAQEQLTKLSEFLKAQQAAVVQIEGHCDERGSIEYNLALGERRAQSVKNYLVQLGIDSSRLPTISYGEEKPVVEGSDESAWSKNRRAEFVLSNP